jgi:hypothetical protein
VYHEPSESPDWVKKIKQKTEYQEDAHRELIEKWGRIGKFMFRILGKKAYVDDTGHQWYYAKSRIHKTKQRKEEKALEREVREGFLRFRGILKRFSLSNLENVMYPKEIFLFMHGIRGNQRKYILSDRTEEILRNWGYGADVKTAFKNNEELVQVLRTLYVIFDFKITVLADYIFRYIKPHYKNVEVVRKELEQKFGIKKPFYNVDISWRERRRAKKVLKELVLESAIADLKAYLNQKELEEATKEAILKWIYSQPRILRELASKIKTK